MEFVKIDKDNLLQNQHDLILKEQFFHYLETNFKIDIKFDIKK